MRPVTPGTRGSASLPLASRIQRLAICWILGTKRDETRQRRLIMLITESASGQRISAVSGKAE